jgi:hypothetical protein
VAGRGHEGGEKPVDADQVAQALAVGDLQRLVGPVAELAGLDAVLGGQHRGAGGAEHVVVGRRALAVATVGTEACEDAGVGELLEAVFGAVQGAEVDLGELVGGEHAVLVDQAEDAAVAVGEAPGEPGELIGRAPRPRARVRSRLRTDRGGVGSRQWCAPPSGVGGAGSGRDSAADVEVGGVGGRRLQGRRAGRRETRGQTGRQTRLGRQPKGRPARLVHLPFSVGSARNAPSP